MILIYELSGKELNAKIKGVNKIAKLDFLLKYPTYLNEILSASNTNVRVLIESFENNSIETLMSSYLYTPWDMKYRKFFNLLIAKDLISVGFENDDYFIQITSKGIILVQELYKNELFIEFQKRASVIRTHFGNYTDNYLSKILYDRIPELTTLTKENSL
ncbi:hypothetical protein [Dysgonomonas mossii]